MKMRCKRCKKMIHENEFCRSCFVKIIDKRVRKDIRIGLNLKKGGRVLVMDPLTRSFTRILPPTISIIYKSKTSLGIETWDNSVYKNDKLRGYIRRHRIRTALVPLTMEAELTKYLDDLFHAKNPKTCSSPRIFPVFSSLSSAELQRYVKYKGMRFKQAKGKIITFLDRIEDEYKGTKASFKNAVKQ